MLLERLTYKQMCCKARGRFAKSAGGEVGEVLKEGSMVGELYASGTVKQNGTKRKENPTMATSSILVTHPSSSTVHTP